MTRTYQRGPLVEVFAVEENAVQLSWPSLPRGEMTFEVGGHRFDVDSSYPDWYRLKWNRSPNPGTGGPGAIVIDGLEAESVYDVLLSGERHPTTRVAVARTLPKAPGRELFRFATISDCHIGEVQLGPLRRLHDPRPNRTDLEPYAVRCARAAIAEAEVWGARLLAVKGDLTRKGHPDELHAAADVLEDATMPVEVSLGNHDVQTTQQAPALLAERGFARSDEARAVDVPGLRLVFGHSPVEGLHGGRLSGEHVREIIDHVRSSQDPVALVLHHPPRQWPVNTYYPPSLGWRDTTALTSGLVATGRACLLLSGHTHRNRRYSVRGITAAEVGATKDYPGQWAGYVVYEGGIRQVVRRIARPDAIAWTEMTKRAAAGVWGWWAPGTIADRCWTLEWPDRIVAAA